jgi:uncharacterized glyoxalase superfamily protein PhnB
MEERRQQQPATLRLRSVTPSFTVNDIQASIEWYRDILGFYVADEHKREGTLLAASLKAGAVEIFLTQDDFAKGRDREKGTAFSLYCTTALDIDDLAADIKARGGVLTQPPTDQSWGVRDFAVTDPDGFKIFISTSLPV